MTALIAGLIVFIGTHSVVSFMPATRAALMQTLGKVGWRSLHGVLAIVGIYLISVGYASARMAPEWLWVAPVWTRHLAALLMLLAFVLVGAALVPGSKLKARFGYPFLLAIKTWAIAHLLANGGLHDVLLFGAFLAWSVAAYVVHRKRDRAVGKAASNGSWARDGLAVVTGVVLWAIVAFWLHAAVIGIAPMGV